MARMKKWRGEEIRRDVAKNVAKAFGKFALHAEGQSKRELKRGHGVESGTLRRSIHTAQPDYNWQADHVEPSPQSPERGNELHEASISGNRITIQLGSGLRYALPVHQGHHSFLGYHYITNGVQKAMPMLPKFLYEHRMM